MLTKEDLTQIEKLGITEQEIAQQIEIFKAGVPFLQIDRAAAKGDGVLVMSDEERQKVLAVWQDFLQGKDCRVTKFVPASGAASRMFKDLFEFAEKGTRLQSVGEVFHNIEKFAFYDELDAKCQKALGKSLEQALIDEEFQAVAKLLLGREGLNYGNLPKGLLLFHRYPAENRTPFLEHLVEGAEYAKRADGTVSLHFTVSPEHRQLFEKHFADNKENYEGRYGVKFSVEFSEQKPSTDTLAVDTENRPFRQADGSLLLRPGGHGALIENLNDLQADVVFIKNIDNVVPDRLKEPTTEYKQLLSGLLVALQRQTFTFLKELEEDDISEAKLQVILQFLRSRLCYENPQTKQMDRATLRNYLREKLNRPIRVCGMVRNEGEPGGGPFWVKDKDGAVSLQILESSQINTKDPSQKNLMAEATHFNPVDLVCGIRNYRGEKFNLPEFVDRNTYFISSKSSEGRELKALELPGLWNGAMAYWNTVFVEVPSSTFSPVKTVGDLLREQHQ